LPKSEQELQAIVTDEVLQWSKKSMQALRYELAEPICYERWSSNGYLQFEALLLEDTADYIHVGISVDDGSEEWSRSPFSSSFLVHSDGRVDV
jgi:hypothetical protein